MANLTPVQAILWVVALEIVSLPIIVFCVNSIFTGYFRAKEHHFARMANTFSRAFEKLSNALEEKIKEIVKNGENNDSNTDG